MIIGERIRQVITDANLDVAEVATALDMTPQNLYKIFKRDSCESKYIERLSELTNTPIAYFFDDKRGNNHQVADRGGVNVAGFSKARNIHTSSRDIEDKRDVALKVCLEKVKGLEKEVSLLREMNEILKSR